MFSFLFCFTSRFFFKSFLIYIFDGKTAHNFFCSHIPTHRCKSIKCAFSFVCDIFDFYTNLHQILVKYNNSTRTFFSLVMDILSLRILFGCILTFSTALCLPLIYTYVFFSFLFLLLFFRFYFISS